MNAVQTGYPAKPWHGEEQFFARQFIAAKIAEIRGPCSCLGKVEQTAWQPALADPGSPHRVPYWGLLVRPLRGMPTPESVQAESTAKAVLHVDGAVQQMFPVTGPC